MKKLFYQFQKETDLVWQTWIRVKGLYEEPPPPPPLKWYEKIWRFILKLFGFWKEEIEPIIPETIEDLSIVFNQWLTIRYNNQRFKFRAQRYPFGERVNKFHIRKWTEALYGKINRKPRARLATAEDAVLYNEPAIQVNDIIYEQAN